MSVAGFFILLAISISLRYIGNRLLPLVMPTGRLRVIALGGAGGFVASWVDRVLWQLGPEVAGINLVAAVVGCALFTLFLGIVPFIKIFLGKI